VTSTAVLELQAAVLNYRVAALEQQLDAERQRRQAVVGLPSTAG
jgi:hypothetical protein